MTKNAVVCGARNIAHTVAPNVELGITHGVVLSIARELIGLLLSVSELLLCLDVDIETFWIRVVKISE